MSRDMLPLKPSLIAFQIVFPAAVPYVSEGSCFVQRSKRGEKLAQQSVTLPPTCNNAKISSCTTPLLATIR